ncbi:MAG: hypothetical protein ACT4PT_05485, partial [Methanobacteriota archaeon]
MTVTVLPVPPAAATSHLVVDAGASALYTAGTPLAASANVFGGTPPFTFSWTFGGSPTRFTNAAAQSTSFSTSGLTGDITLTVSVTDSLGAFATDTVKHAAPATVLSVSDTIDAGIPDDILEPGLLDTATKTHTFTIPAGTGFFRAVLTWPNSLDDLDLYLVSPTGAVNTAGATGNRPEDVTLSGPAGGVWTAEIQGFSNDATSYTLTITAPPPLPFGLPHGPYSFGSLDVQRVHGEAALGTNPAGAWDTNLDGDYETAGATAVLSLPTGTHTVAFKVTDANGFETLRRV